MNFPLNFSVYLNFYNYISLSWGNIFWELKIFSGTNGPVVDTFSIPGYQILKIVDGRTQTTDGC